MRRSWSGNTFLSVPYLFIGAGDASDSIVVGRGRAGSHTVAVVMNMESLALSARSSNKEQVAVVKVEIVAGCGQGDVSVDKISTSSECGSVVSDDESSKSMEG